MKLSGINSVLIVGCGWVGTKLAKKLIDQNIKVYGTTRSDEKAEKLNQLNIHPILFDLDEPNVEETELPSVDAVIISVSPGRGPDRSNYPKHISILGKLLGSTNQHVVMYSSTSAYSGCKGLVNEFDKNPDAESENTLLAAEGALRNHIPSSTILRLGGLFGSDRHPVKYLAGRKNISGGDAPVNLVHRRDVINATLAVLGHKVTNQVFNVVNPNHPSKKEYYTSVAKKLCLGEPEFESGGKDGKKVNGDKIEQKLRFEYSHANLCDYEIGLGE